ncbi:DUF5304 family protein [Streptacidiphilus rugosus]|uniref:DUF5304 family protein n=1 Tax=Streptacidiphilus rugosus TaxID=405783 RepID=UPI00068A0F6C|nr:DUF5304 family protein [Streptacidiphilus rugosus]
MTSADDSAEQRPDADVWAEAVAEQQQNETEPVPFVKDEPAVADEPAAAPAAEQPAGESGDAKGQRPSGGPELPFGADLGPLVDEVRKFASAVGEKVSAVGNGGSDPMEVLQNLAAPLRTKNPAVYGHLLAAGGELIAAYRAAVSASERRWSAPKQNGSEHIDLD